MKRTFTILFCLALSNAVATDLSAQAEPTANAMAAQQEAMQALSWMDGEWSGKVVLHDQTGTRTLIQTERIRSMLEGTLKLIEGAGYAEDGSRKFAAVALLSYDTRTKAFRMSAHNQGRTADPEFKLADGGFDWTIEEGPVTIRYEARYAHRVWSETGTMIYPGRDPFIFVEMELRKVDGEM